MDGKLCRKEICNDCTFFTCICRIIFFSNTTGRFANSNSRFCSEQILQGSTVVYARFRIRWNIQIFLAIAAFSPVPYKVSTIASGFVKMDLVPFILISSFGRAARFFLVASLFYFYGPSIKAYIEKYFDKLALAFVVLLIGGFVLLKFIV